jgi:NAD(P)-dependent dehydrogenase (short-subunit alcohol dehydrogenase family)
MNKIAIVTGGSSGIGHCTPPPFGAGAVSTIFPTEVPAEGIFHFTADVTDVARVTGRRDEIVSGRADRHFGDKRALESPAPPS